MFPFPWFNSEFFTYIKQTFFQYGRDMSLGQKYKAFVEAFINGHPEKMDPAILATLGKITIAYNFFQGKIHQITLPLYFWYALLSNGNDLCDIKADGVEEEGVVSYLSLAYHCLVSLLMMFFGSIALMQSHDLTTTFAQIMIATKLTDFEGIKKIAAEKHVPFFSKFMEKFNPTQRTLELKQTADKQKYGAFESAFTYANLGYCALLSKTGL